MAYEILAIYEPNGADYLPSESRNDVQRQLSEANIIYSDTGGEGIRTFMLQNISPTLAAERLRVENLQEPYDPDTGKVLTQQWSHYLKREATWSGWSNTLLIGDLLPGESVQVRMRLSAGADAVPTSYGGNAQFLYEAVTV